MHPSLSRHRAEDRKELCFLARLYGGGDGEPQRLADRIDVVARLLLSVEDLGRSTLCEAGFCFQPTKPVPAFLECVPHARDPFRRDLTPGAGSILPMPRSPHSV